MGASRWLRRRPAAAMALVLLGGAIAAACSSGGSPSSSQETPASQQQTPVPLLTQLDQGQGGVSVEATWVTPANQEQMGEDALRRYPPKEYVLVLLKLDTHSVDLSRYDMPSLANLRGQNGTPVAALAWVGLSESSHHREGVLVFPGQGSEQWMSQTGQAELTLKGVAGVAERVFRWQF